MSEKLFVRARVRLVVEFVVPSRWGEECLPNEIYRQAEEDAVQCLRNGLIINHLKSSNYASVEATVIGNPKIVLIMAEKEGG